MATDGPLIRYCTVVTSGLQSFQKTTNLWSDHVATIETFVHQDGSYKKECTRQTPCHFFGSHAQVRPVKGQKGRPDRGSIYPDQLCFLLANAGSRLMGIVRTQELDPANTKDGNRDKCTRCGNLKRGGIVHACDGCADAYHRRCISSSSPNVSLIATDCH